MWRVPTFRNFLFTLFFFLFSYNVQHCTASLQQPSFVLLIVVVEARVSVFDRWCCQDIWGRHWKAGDCIFWAYWMGHTVLILVCSVVLPWKTLYMYFQLISVSHFCYMIYILLFNFGILVINMAFDNIWRNIVWEFTDGSDF